MEKTEKIEKTEKKFRLTGCRAVKIVVFFLMLVSVAATVLGYGMAVECNDLGGYAKSRDEAVKNMLKRTMSSYVYSEVWVLLKNERKEAATRYLKKTNMEAALLSYDDIDAENSDSFLWQSYAPQEAMEQTGFYSDLYIDYAFYGEDDEVIRIFFDRAFPKDDAARKCYQEAVLLYRYRYGFIGAAVGGSLTFMTCLVFLLCAAGHRNGKEGITPILTTRLPFDLFTAFLMLVLVVSENILSELTYVGISMNLSEILLYVEAGILSFVWLYDLVVRLKLGKWWRNTICYSILCILRRALVSVETVFLGVCRRIPLVMKTLIVYFVACYPEWMLISWRGSSEVMTIWFLWKLFQLFAVLYVALMCKALLKASRELANGNEAYAVDTGGMFGEFKEHGENLNSLGKGIARAVAERMKSEHLKTELITNVSHDIKTPLTSIINYADLLGNLPEAADPEGQDGECVRMEREKFQEYTEVLLRQSRRLKKLLEDLVEASKATTGNLEVMLAPCEVGVLLTQAVGEYQQKMEERGLELRSSQPEEPVEILADGRHLWRVFDNLLNNICKYAQENSRVYLSLERREDKVDIVFRNMSRYALNISPEELEERFVRGDRSRHMEGNGLGLSIAKSLAELQNGEMKIVIDGDLFKVTLTFQALPGRHH